MSYRATAVRLNPQEIPGVVYGDPSREERDLAWIRRCVQFADREARGEIFLLAHGCIEVGEVVEVRPGLFGRTVAFPPPPAHRGTHTTVLIHLTAARAWLADRRALASTRTAGAA